MESFFSQIKDLWAELKASIIYDFLKRPLPKVNVPSELPIILRRIKGGIAAESILLPGFIATASSIDLLPQEIYDTFLVYFDIPRVIATRLKYPKAMRIRTPKGQVVVNADKDARFILNT